MPPKLNWLKINAGKQYQVKIQKLVSSKMNKQYKTMQHFYEVLHNQEPMMLSATDNLHDKLQCVVGQVVKLWKDAGDKKPINVMNEKGDIIFSGRHDETQLSETPPETLAEKDIKKDVDNFKKFLEEERPRIVADEVPPLPDKEVSPPIKFVDRDLEIKTGMVYNNSVQLFGMAMIAGQSMDISAAVKKAIEIFNETKKQFK